MASKKKGTTPAVTGTFRSTRTTPAANKATEAKDATPAADKKSAKRRLIVLCDGTWQNSYRDGGKSPTNVTRLARAIKPVADDGTPQICLYMPGIGATATVAILKDIEGACGAGFADLMHQAYGFLAYNYQEGDSIYLFGFSRGAYLVRAVCGLITECGLLTKEGMSRFVELLYCYQERILDSNNDSYTETKLLRLVKELCRNGILTMSSKVSPDKIILGSGLEVEAIGCFDTVGALDIFSNSYSFLNVTYNSKVKRAYHALALDEDRKLFRPTLWFFDKKNMSLSHFKQVWFTGVHSNIGGGSSDAILRDTNYLENSSSDAISLNVLSDGPLIWMVDQVKDLLEFDYTYLQTTIIAGKTKTDGSGKLVRIMASTVSESTSDSTSDSTSESSLYGNRDGYRTKEFNKFIANELKGLITSENEPRNAVGEIDNRGPYKSKLRTRGPTAPKLGSDASDAWYRGPLFNNYAGFVSRWIYARESRTVKGCQRSDGEKPTNELLHESVFRRGKIVETKTGKRWWRAEHVEPLKDVYWDIGLHGTVKKDQESNEKKIAVEMYSGFESEFWDRQQQLEAKLEKRRQDRQDNIKKHRHASAQGTRTASKIEKKKSKQSPMNSAKKSPQKSPSKKNKTKSAPQS